MEFDGLSNAKTRNFVLELDNELGKEVVKIDFPPIKRFDNLKDLKSHLLDYKEAFKKIVLIDRNAAYPTYRMQELREMGYLYFQSAILPEKEMIHNLYKVIEIAQKREAFTELANFVEDQINQLEIENDVYQKRRSIKELILDEIPQKIMDHYMSAIQEEVVKNGNVGFKNWENDINLLVTVAEEKGIKNIRGNEEKIYQLWGAIKSGVLQKQLDKENRANEMDKRFNNIINRIEYIENHLAKVENQLEQVNEKLINILDKEKVTGIKDGFRQMIDTEFVDLDKYPRNKNLNLDEILRKARSKSQPSYSISTSSINPAPSRNKRTQDRDAR